MLVPYTTKSGVKIYEERQAKRANADPVYFWLIKFVQEMAKKNGERYPPKIH